MSELGSKLIKQIEFAAELFRRAKHPIALTGAGISTPSGIPDFRSEGTGLWSEEEAMDVASLSTFRYEPATFYNWFRPLASQMINAAPNLAHTALAALQQAGYLDAVITQNVDLLHSKAGSSNIIEMHGTLRTLSCTQCFKTFDSTSFLAPYIEERKLPHCPECGAILKPDVILFGEELPQQAWLKAKKESRKSDLMIVIGSSLEVLPVARLPMHVLDRGGHLIIVNRAPTYLNIRADIVLPQDAATVLPLIVQEVLDG